MDDFALPTYKEIENVLKKTPAKYNAAEVHGLMCGLICNSAGDKEWQAVIIGKKKKSAEFDLLHRLYENSFQQMSEFSFEFSLLLPEDNIDINKRTEALGLWCQGFLIGLENGQIQIKNLEPSELTEALDDIIEIAQVTYGNITNTEEDETAYFELVEYVRLAVLMIFQELKLEQQPNEFDNDSLH